jgi:hypothetical protein
MTEDYSVSGRGKRFCSNILTRYGACQDSHAVGSDSSLEHAKTPMHWVVTPLSIGCKVFWV